MRYYSAAVTTKDRIAWSNKDGPFRTLAVSDSCSLRCGVWDQHGPQSFRLWFRAYTPNFKPNHYTHTHINGSRHPYMRACMHTYYEEYMYVGLYVRLFSEAHSSTGHEVTVSMIRSRTVYSRVSGLSVKLQCSPASVRRHPFKGCILYSATKPRTAALSIIRLTPNPLNPMAILCCCLL